MPVKTIKIRILFRLLILFDFSKKANRKEIKHQLTIRNMNVAVQLSRILKKFVSE
jgi:hypothetical protein